MQLDSSFSVDAPIESVWVTLMDFEKVAGCVPGAQILDRLSEDVYQVGMKVKLGPVTMQYRGRMEVVERDAAGHRAVLSGTAKETRGQGTAQATATLSLAEEAGTTRGSVSADVALSGRAAAMGQSIIGAVTDQMIAQFAQNLQVMLNAGGGQGAAGVGAALPAAGAAGAVEDPTPPDVAVGADGPAGANAATGAGGGGPAGDAESVAEASASDADPEPVATPAAHPEPESAAPASNPEPVAAAWASDADPGPVAAAWAAEQGQATAGPPATDSLNALTLAMGIARAQMGNPRTVGVLLAGVALVSYKLGQLATRRERARWLGRVE